MGKKSKKSGSAGNPAASTQRNAEASGSGAAFASGLGFDFDSESVEEAQRRHQYQAERAQNGWEFGGGTAGRDMYGESVSDDEEEKPFIRMPLRFDSAGNYVHHGQEKAEDPTKPIRDAGRSVFEAKEPFSEEMATSTLKILQDGVVEFAPTVGVLLIGVLVGGRLLSSAVPYGFRALNWTIRSILVAVEWTLLMALWLIDWLDYIGGILFIIALVLVGLAIAFYHITIEEKRRIFFVRLFGTATPSLADTTPALLLDISLCIVPFSLFFLIPFRFALPLASIWPAICVAGLCGYSVIAPLDSMAIGWLTMRRDVLQDAVTAREQRAE